MDKSSNPERPDGLIPANGVKPTPTDTPATDPPLPAPPPPPLTPLAWLSTNGVYLVIAVGVAVFIYRNAGLGGLLKVSLSLLGVGFLIFVHELGHFLAAKWCDVQVNTFSVGFGPAIPGLSFQRGETLYQIGLIPLGGYVSMVGEGTDTEENEDYPRSFKNKTVFQRMLIISAGVTMNVLLGGILFVIVYMLHGVEHPPAIVYRVDNGSPAWRAGVRTDTRITRLGDVQNPYFDDLKYEVALSSHGQEIEFVFSPLHGDGKPWPPIKIEPQVTDRLPMIGISPPDRPIFDLQRHRPTRQAPVQENSAAAAARALPLKAGDLVVAATDPAKENELTPIPHDRAKKTFDAQELCQRLEKLKDRPIQLEVLRAGQDKPERIEIPVGGFAWGDEIVATTNSGRPEELFQLEELPPDPTNTSGESFRDFFVFRRRLHQLAGKPMAIQVRRKQDDSSTALTFLVPPAFHATLGLQMRMGEVAAVRQDSPAAKAGIRGRATYTEPDKITKVVMKYQDGTHADIDLADPMRIPFLLEQAAHKRPQPDKPVQVELTLLRFDPNTGNIKGLNTQVTLDWEDKWDYQEDTPLGNASPLSIPQLGLAYWVECLVDRVVPSGPADKAGVKENDQFVNLAMREMGKKGLTWTNTEKLDVKKSWATTFWILQIRDVPTIKVDVKRGEELVKDVEINSVRDRTWPLVERGFLFQGASRLQRADSITQALVFGAERTVHDLKMLYLQLRSLLTRRISTDNLGGPGELIAQAYTVAEDPYVFLLWLATISLNLAVVNFLPIPILDGGHMLFLIWEAIVRRRPSEAVQAIATYAGLAFILSLMCFVIYLDVVRRWSSFMTWFQ